MGEALSALARLHDAVTRLGFHLSKLCLGIIVVAYCYEVFARYFFGAPTWWSNEAVQYSLCIGCFLMMPHVTKEKGHVAVTVILDMFAAEKTRILYWVIYLVGFLACAAATWISLDENIRQIVKDVHLMKVKPIPKIYISAWITYGFASSAIYFLRMLDPRSLAVARPAGGMHG